MPDSLIAFCERLGCIPFFQRSGKLPEGIRLFKHSHALKQKLWAEGFNGLANGTWSKAYEYALHATVKAGKANEWLDTKRSVLLTAQGTAIDPSRAKVGMRIQCQRAVEDAILYAQIRYTCDGLDLPPEITGHIKKRWAVWEAGYYVYCDMDGVLYCTEQK